MDEITTQFTAGDEIKYMLPDKNGKPHWFNGIIHGVRRYEGRANVISHITYLVDTGRDERVDEYPFDHRDREITKRVHARIANDPKRHTDHNGISIKHLNAVLKEPDLPESKMDVERVRQPEQLELPAQNVKSR